MRQSTRLVNLAYKLNSSYCDGSPLRTLVSRQHLGVASATMLLSTLLAASIGCSGLQNFRTRGLASQPKSAPVGDHQPLEQKNQLAQSSSDPSAPSKMPLAEVVPASHQGQVENCNSGTCNSGACGTGTCGTGACGTAMCGSDGCGDGVSDCGTLIDQRRLDPQEHLFDGGDLEPYATVRKDWSAAGIDSTDTVAYYETAGGKVCVQPSNRVAIYAPRFGAVRQVTGAISSDSTLAPGRMIAPLAADGINDRNRADGLAISAGPMTKRQIQQLDRFRDDRRMIPVTSVIPPTPISDAVAALVNVDVSSSDLAANRETTAEKSKTFLVETTTLPESIAVMIGGQVATASVGTKQAAEVLLYETPDRCSLRITKSASHTMAHSGDTIRFTIRFENIGPNKVGNVVIIDSLSSRLEYIGGSQLSSLQAKFSAEPNEAGSAKLKWELEMPLEPNADGVLSFDCRVR